MIGEQSVLSLVALDTTHTHNHTPVHVATIFTTDHRRHRPVPSNVCLLDIPFEKTGNITWMCNMNTWLTPSHSYKLSETSFTLSRGSIVPFVCQNIDRKRATERGLGGQHWPARAFSREFIIGDDLCHC